ncbi:hypothetical protein BV22DRAFT_457510 [Leucogyrophana mollusca]|uniref:Uncharacterized protein n=1 Tax=Leucogyrophana mollusca TaxID=85980 RepID=A0ACB8BGY0_9AGAM|nr:hypothetical protein BV22DRAFT_457510 [Leucogyrophana mollusca]
MSETDRPDLPSESAIWPLTCDHVFAALQVEDQRAFESLQSFFECRRAASGIRGHLKKLFNSGDVCHEGSSSPISRLPCMILIKIFHHGHVLEGHGSRHELVMSHVCRSWRTIMIRTPSLWTSIRIPPTQSPVLFDLYIERSQNLPLDVLLKGSFNDVLLQGRLLASMRQASAVLSCAHRMRTLKIIVSGDMAYHLLSHFRDVRMPLLRELRVSLTEPEVDHGDAPFDPPFPLLGGGAPALSVLELDCITNHFSAYPVASQLLTSLILSSSLHDHCMPWNEFYQLALALPNLASLGFRGVPVALADGSGVHINLPNLHSLKFDMREPFWGHHNFAGDMLMLLSAPSLTELSLLLECDDDGENNTDRNNASQSFVFYLHATVLYTIIIPPFPALRSLTLACRFDGARGGASKIFVAFPSVTRVIMIGSCASHLLKGWQKADQHFPGLDKQIPWIHLRELELYEPVVDWIDLLSVLELRRRDNLPLKTLRISHSRANMIDVFPLLVGLLNTYVKVETAIGEHCGLAY